MERSSQKQIGAGLVDVMVGVAAALFAVLVIYVVVTQSDRFRHDAQSAGDAQQTGLFALSRLSFDIGNAGTPMASRMANGVLQADGEVRPEPLMDVEHVANAVLYMANLPLDANVLFMTVMATKMPFVGRG